VHPSCRRYGLVGGISQSPSDSRNPGAPLNRERNYPAEGMIERMKDLVCIADSFLGLVSRGIATFVSSRYRTTDSGSYSPRAASPDFR
jgi:hypothetical protein